MQCQYLLFNLSPTPALSHSPDSLLLHIFEISLLKFHLWMRPIANHGFVFGIFRLNECLLDPFSFQKDNISLFFHDVNIPYFYVFIHQ